MDQPGIRRLGCVAVASLVLTVACAPARPQGLDMKNSGTGATRSSGSPPSVSRTFIIPTVDASCPDVSGSALARGGLLSLGPFSTELTQVPAATHQAKLWIASDRSGRDDAVVSVTSPDGKAFEYRRPAATASIETAAQFWPGTIAIPVEGLYRIEVRAGADEVCIRARYAVVGGSSP